MPGKKKPKAQAGNGAADGAAPTKAKAKDKAKISKAKGEAAGGDDDTWASLDQLGAKSTSNGTATHPFWIYGLDKLLLGALVMLPHAHSLFESHSFLMLDDGHNFQANALIQNATWSNVEAAFRFRDGIVLGVYEPMLTLFKMKACAFFGLSASAFKNISLVSHAAVAVLAYMLLCRVLYLASKASFRKDVAFAASLLFALHPLRVEVVRWMSAGGYLQGSILVLLSLRLHLVVLESKSSQVIVQVAAWIVYSMAVLSKAATVTASLAHFVLAICLAGPIARDQRKGSSLTPWKVLRSALLYSLPYFAISALGIWAALQASGNIADKDNIFMVNKTCKRLSQDPLSQILRATFAVWFYLYKSVDPSQLNLRYLAPPNQQLLAQPYLTAVLAFLAVSLGGFGVAVAAARKASKTGGGTETTAWRQCEMRCSMFLLWALFLGLLLPSLGLGHSHVCWMNDRYTYLPHLLVGLPVMAAVLGNVQKLVGARFAPFVTQAAVCVCAFFALQTHRAGSRWDSEETLYRHAIAMNPKDEVAHFNLAFILEQDSSRQQESIRLTRKALRIDPESASGWTNLGLAENKKGEVSKALEAFQKAYKLNPQNEQYLQNLGRTLSKKDPMGALAMYESAMEQLPNSVAVLDDLASLYAQIGRSEEALKLFQRVLSQEPQHLDALILSGNIHKRNRSFEAAMVLFQRAVAAHPNSAVAHGEVGGMLLQARKHEEAVQSLQRSIAIDPTSYPNSWFKLGFALDTIGKWEEARAAYETVVKLRPTTSLDAHQNLGVLLYEHQQYEAALGHFEHVVASDKVSPDVLKNYGSTLQALGRESEATRALETAQHLIEMEAAKLAEATAESATPEHSADGTDPDAALPQEPPAPSSGPPVEDKTVSMIDRIIQAEKQRRGGSPGGASASPSDSSSPPSSSANAAASSSSSAAAGFRAELNELDV